MKKHLKKKKSQKDLSARWKITSEFGRKKYAETLLHVNS